jgi:hypothetical protein
MPSVRTRYLLRGVSGLRLAPSSRRLATEVCACRRDELANGRSEDYARLQFRAWARKSSTNHGSARCAATRPGYSSTATQLSKHLKAGSKPWRTRAMSVASSAGIEWTRPSVRAKKPFQKAAARLQPRLVRLRVGRGSGQGTGRKPSHRKVRGNRP